MYHSVNQTLNRQLKILTNYFRYHCNHKPTHLKLKMPPSPASKKRKTEIQVVESVQAYETNVKGETNVLDSIFREYLSSIAISKNVHFLF